MDAASNNSVDDIRELRERVGISPTQGRRKVYILDEVHMLSTAAWNAFLKTLEEPPPHAIFVLATTDAHKVLPTIVDRCQRFDFRRPSLEQLLTVLRRVCDSEGIEADDRALALIARSAAGQLPRRARHARPARQLRRHQALDRRRDRAARRQRLRPDLRRDRRDRRARSARGARARRRAGRLRPRPGTVHGRSDRTPATGRRHPDAWARHPTLSA